METIFSRIISGEIPSVQLHADDTCIAILDIAPVNKGHALVIARHPYPTVGDCPVEVLGHLMEIVQRIDAVLRSELGAEATNIVINNGPAAGQEVPHLHIHVIPRYEGDGKRFIPSKTQYGEGEIAELGARLHLR
ncbi:MAG: HIT family protein [Spirochaetae bacterium HGW-Spirochaetae-4]|nr:MAG: HIT family hydrolase [Spirochaetes bacterium GWC2_52_13]PKL20780.1 MAG: HIT family protein [Spirochaetae bacterium HGW-Spirochaetae-4]HCG63405.1 HIT family protein [Sphaerochaeta sp.]HCS35869.1 HIT family protein [Sphaerochaeta sp.]